MKIKILSTLILCFIFISGCIQESGPVECGEDMECFVQASESCNPAEVTYTTTVNIFGIEQTTETYMEIKGMEEDKCILYMKWNEITVEFPTGTPQESIDEMNQVYEELEGNEGICKLDAEDLTSILNSWNSGSYSTEDLDIAECSGSMFEN